MWIKCIRLYQFRNINEQEIKLSPNVNILIGKNGQGKTNFVESLYLTLKGISFRFAENKNLIQLSKKQSSLIAIVEDDNCDNIFHVQTNFENVSKKHFLNHKAVSASTLNLFFSAILFSPESLEIIKSDSLARRNFIDEFIINLKNKEFFKIKFDYQKILKTRNKILKDIRDENIKKEQGLLVLKSLENNFLKLATEYTFLRTQKIKEILPSLNKAVAEIMGDNMWINVDYLISGENAMHYTISEIYDKLKSRLSELQSGELSLGHSLVGPQKHDIHFLVNNQDSRIFCSQGQQRALILSFKIAEVVYYKKLYGTYPLLILDDVFSELDNFRREKLMAFLETVNSQIIVTTTDEFLNNNFKLKESTLVINVNEGKFNSVKKITELNTAR